MIIQTNINALKAMGYAVKENKSSRKLASGFKINCAADNAAGLSISEQMRAHEKGLIQANMNVQDGISLIQTAEGALSEQQNIVHRIRELSVQSANDTNTTVDRESINQEVQELLKEIDRISQDTEFNTLKLLNGDCGNVNLSYTKGITESVWGVSTRTDLINFATVRNGAEIHIEGVNFIFTDNGSGGTGSPDEYLVNIGKNASPSEKATAFEDAFWDSNLPMDGFSIAVFQEDGPVYSVILDYDGSGPKLPTDDLDIKYKAPPAGGGGLHLQVGSSSGDGIKVSIDETSTDALGIKRLNVLTHTSAEQAIAKADVALNMLSDLRAALGTVQNRLEHVYKNNSVYEENLSDAESRIRDTDMAEEVTKYYKQNILNQTAQAVLVHAEKEPQGVLKLLE